jgi:hypothetical protein
MRKKTGQEIHSNVGRNNTTKTEMKLQHGKHEANKKKNLRS